MNIRFIGRKPVHEVYFEQGGHLYLWCPLDLSLSGAEETSNAVTCKNCLSAKQRHLAEANKKEASDEHKDWTRQGGTQGNSLG